VFFFSDLRIIHADPCMRIADMLMPRYAIGDVDWNEGVGHVGNIANGGVGVSTIVSFKSSGGEKGGQGVKRKGEDLGEVKKPTRRGGKKLKR